MCPHICRNECDVPPWSARPLTRFLTSRPAQVWLAQGLTTYTAGMGIGIVVRIPFSRCRFPRTRREDHSGSPIAGNPVPCLKIDWFTARGLAESSAAGHHIRTVRRGMAGMPIRFVPSMVSPWFMIPSEYSPTGRNPCIHNAFSRVTRKYHAGTGENTVWLYGLLMDGYPRYIHPL